jgi:hypothetical protein
MGCHYYTATVASGGNPQNTASYYLPISSAYNGYYHVRTFIPCDSHSSATSGKWRAFPNGTAAGYVGINRLISGYCDSWMNPDNRTYYGSSGGYIQLTDNVGAGYYLPADVTTYSP